MCSYDNNHLLAKVLSRLNPCHALKCFWKERWWWHAAEGRSSAVSQKRTPSMSGCVFLFSVWVCFYQNAFLLSVSKPSGLQRCIHPNIFCSSGRKVERGCKLLFPLDKHWHRSWQLVPKIQEISTERQKEVFFANIHHCTNMQQHGATSPFHSFLWIWSFDFFKTVHLVSKHWKVWLIAPESSFSPFGCFI